MMNLIKYLPIRELAILISILFLFLSSQESKRTIQTLGYSLNGIRSEKSYTQ